MTEPTTTDSGIDLDRFKNVFLPIVMTAELWPHWKEQIIWLAERLRTAEQYMIDIQARIASASQRADFEADRVARLSERGAQWSTDKRELEAKLAAAEAEHEKDKLAWMNENTELLTQVRSLTAERDELQADFDAACTSHEVHADALREQVERLEARVRDALLRPMHLGPVENT